MKIVLASFTPATASGGVPRWNRDFMAGFGGGEVVHYSWEDVLRAGNRDTDIPEWTKARVLLQWLKWSKRLDSDDVLIGDGFWADVNGVHPIERTVSISHGNWSHTTLDDVNRGVPPEFPDHHRAQLEFRRRHVAKGGRLVAVSDFIAHQCKIQWGLDQPVINNGIDMVKFQPASFRVPRKRPVVVHGVTNGNKGTDHIRMLERKLDVDVLLLDDAARFFNSLQSERRLTKYEALAQADLVVVPSAHEGNSYFLLEALASGIPVVGYNVGLMYQAWNEGAPIGWILQKEAGYTPERTLAAVDLAFGMLDDRRPREWVSQFSLQEFQLKWTGYLRREFGYGAQVPG